MDYQIPRPIVDGSPLVFAYMVNGQRVYVKKRRPAKNPLGWRLQRILYGFTKFLLVLPPDRPARNNVLFEAATLRRLREMGISVPLVLHETNEYFVMTETGRNLEAVLRENPDKAPHYIEKAARELRRLHGFGIAHGGSQIKNMTVHDGEIYFIDFEESIPERRLAQFQMRDLFLFIFSLERCGHDPDLQQICRVYDGGDGGTIEEIRRALRQLRVVRLTEWKIFDRFSMRDIRCLSRLVRKAMAL